MIKKLVKRLIASSVGMASKTSLGRTLCNEVVNTIRTQSVAVTHGPLGLTLQVPNLIAYWRAATFSQKEPETLEWIDQLPEGAVLWDIGANVGLYSVYAAKRRNCRVCAFEPSVFNLELLARNASLNGVVDRVCIVPLPLTDKLGVSELNLTSTEWGGALSTFDKHYGWDGKTFEPIFQFQTVGVSMVDAVQRLGLPQPDYVKMDVDGIEHLILQGGGPVLAQVKGIHIEVNDAFAEQADLCRQLLQAAGLELKEKRHSDMIENADFGFDTVFNQTWVRP